MTDKSTAPMVFRRTLLIVRDMDASLALYRDALGLEVQEVEHRRSPATATTDEEAETVTRVVTLLGDKDEHFAGLLKLCCFVKPARPPRPDNRDGIHKPGDVLLFFSLPDVMSIYDKVKDAPGVQVVRPPPGHPGSTHLYTLVYDNDGNWVEVSEATDPRTP